MPCHSEEPFLCRKDDEESKTYAFSKHGRPRFLTPLRCVRNDTHRSRLTNGNV